MLLPLPQESLPPFHVLLQIPQHHLQHGRAPVALLIRVVLHLDVVQPGVDVVVLLHEVVECPDLGTQLGHVPLVPGEVRLCAGLQVVSMRDVQVIPAEIFQDRIFALLPLKLVFIIL